MTNEVTQIIQNHFWGEGSEWFWAYLQFVIVALTLVFIAIQVWLQTKQTKIESMSHVVESVSTIQEKWISETMQRVRREVCVRWNQREFDGACEHIANFFEELGTFVKIGAIPKETVWDVWSWNVEHYWKIFEDGIKKERETCEEEVFCEFERLFQGMRKISEKKGAPPVDGKSITKFVEREIRMTKACLDLLSVSQKHK